MASQITQTPPDEVAQITATNQLGSFSQSYHVQSPSQAVLDSLTLILLCVFIILVCCIFILHVGGDLILAFTAATGAGALISIFRAVKARENVVYLFQNGFIYSQREQHTPFLWSQIAGCQIRPEWLYGRLDRCIVRTTTGRRIPIGNLAGYEELATNIENAVESHELRQEP